MRRFEDCSLLASLLDELDKLAPAWDGSRFDDVWWSFASCLALASSPQNVFLLFAVNSIPALLIFFLTGLWGILAGVFIGWMAYLIATEEIHWRIHMNGRLPAALQFARAYHMSHHNVPTSRYNVFLPLCDVLLGSAHQMKRLPQSGPFTAE
jgi:hypothetical protein